MLERYTVDPGEYTLARSCGNGCTFSVVGTRWGFLNRYDRERRRVWRSPPIPVSGCDRVDETSLASWGRWDSGFHYLDLGRCTEGQPNLWLWRADDSLFPVTVQDRDPADESRADLQAEPFIHARLSAQASLAEATAALQAQWRRHKPSHGNGYLSVAPPPALWIDQGGVPGPSALRIAHAEAGQIWRERATGKPEERAVAAVAAMAPVLSILDWRELPGSELDLLNDVGFWLQQTGRCEDAVDAVVLLEEVVRRAPERTPARLNLADAQAQTRIAPCRDRLPRMLVANMISVQENARLYCVAQGPARIPANIADRLAYLLQVQSLDAEVCRPRGDIIRAVQAGDAVALARALKAHPEDLNQPSPRGYLPLREAIERGWLQGAEQLLAAGADPDRSGLSVNEYSDVPLVTAIYRHDLPMVNLLLRYHARNNPDLVRDKPLLVAAGLHGKDEQRPMATAMVQALLDSGAYLRQKNEDAETALMLAAASGNLATVDLLLARDHGVLLNATDKYGRNALHHVPPFDNDRLLVWKRLLERGGNINQQDKNGHTPLSRLFLFSGGEPDIIALMVKDALRYRVDFQLADLESGQVVLHRAAAAGNLPVVRALTSAGAPRCPRDRKGKTPADWAGQRVANIQANGVCPEHPSCAQLKALKAIVKRLDCPVRDMP